ncbi:hypothetical protein [Ornithinimicrobium kibberense]|uniref:hypothetical protein n=1 Tax=Ornithinimicrobium kibberense TaxID=282060 RepID=UPI00361B7B22
MARSASPVMTTPARSCPASAVASNHSHTPVRPTSSSAMADARTFMRPRMPGRQERAVRRR